MTIEFYFDFASPYGFIAAMKIEAVQLPVVWSVSARRRLQEVQPERL